jgi:NAD(P)-dependent dehydrogenase (short-subunit alcohol dehydrogenase family)
MAFTRAVAREAAGAGVRVNAVAPGPIDTDLLHGAAADHPLGPVIRQGMIDATVLRRLGQPEEVAAGIAYLASDDATYVVGLVLPVSGGLCLY